MRFKPLFLTITVLLTLPFIATAQQEHTIFRHGGGIQTVAYSPVNSSLIASAGDNGTIKLWDLQNDTVLTLRGHTGQINSVAFSPDGQLLASGGDDWTFRLWNVRTRQRIATLEHITDRTRSPIEEVAFSSDGQLLATAGLHVKLWQVSTQTEIATLRHDEYVRALAFSPDGQLLAAGDRDGLVKVWNLQDRQVISQLDGDTVIVYTLDFSPDGRTLASAGYDGQIKLWTVSDWTLLGTFQDRETAYTLDFSPDGKALVSTGHAAVILWSVESGEEITSLIGHSGWVNGSAFSPDGKTLVSGGDDGTVRVQNIESYLQTLQQREMVRLIYFLPRNRIAQQDIDTKLDTLIKDVQQFYTQQMNAHGFGGKTFTFETDATGNAVVHHVKGRFSDAYYRKETFDKIIEEVEERFDLSKNIYLISIDTGSEKIDVQWCGKGGIHGTTGGKAVVPASGGCFVGDQGIDTAAHELGHAFGLDHDFRDDAYLMSYGSDPNQLSYCAAEWLDVHHYFNTHQTSFNEPTVITMLTPLALPSNAIRFRFKAADADGLHQAQLIIPTSKGDPADGVKLHSCEVLNSEINQIAFTTTEVTPGFATEVTLRVIDVYGNFMQETYPISANDVAYVDVNADGVMDVDDLVVVASHFGTATLRGADPNPDVNNDGVVNREDLLLVVEALESQESTPTAPTLIADNLQRWIFEAKRRNYRDTALQSGIVVLEQLLTQFHPRETALLPNYPNPFNPETWIPYQLAAPADVSLSIYAVNGQIVRQLALGYQPAGVYQSQSTAVYWDGRNELGEPVASGVYFYTLSAGDFTATRRMLIQK
ncbi:MAG: T9SS type A sorting domain-containing protein [Candidatus Poribacteria bacterium]|nr:T9SS type A sorting domain-containing protein [Candidatus Poribacteria bacterium]MDE0327403.1 T9SS type A sorting domain-containing protein [Candidatus Poribacteria bacterium]